MKRHLAGFDIGGTKLAFVLAEETGSIIYRKKDRTDVSSDGFSDYKDGIGYHRVSEQMIELLKQGIAETGTESILGIGIDSAGPLKDGDIRNSTNIKPHHLSDATRDRPFYIPLVRPLKEEFSVPIKLMNDCVASVLGEVYYGIGKDVPNKDDLYIVYVTLSTGMGGGVWDGGHLLSGKHGNAAEVGHFFVAENGRECGCGNRGCAEAYLSGTGIAGSARAALAETNPDLTETEGSILIRMLKEVACKMGHPQAEIAPAELVNLVSSPVVFSAADAGDALSRRVIAEACRYGGIAFADIANAYNPQVITVGGPLAINHPSILPRISKEMQKHVTVESPRIQLTPLGDQVAEYGAIVLAQQAADHM